MTARSEPPSPIPAGPRAWTDFGGGPGRERWILPFTAVLALGLVLAGLAAAISWIDWRWVLLGLCAVAVVLPCGVLALQGRLDLFEPLTWFAVMFLLLFVTRPAWDLGHENFIYTGRLISPTFTKMIVAGLLAATGFVIGYLTPAGESLASRLPRPSTLDSRRLLIWSTLVFAVALAAFAAFFVEAHGWRDPAHFFFGQNRIRFKAIASTPEATSKYFLVSIVLDDSRGPPVPVDSAHRGRGDADQAPCHMGRPRLHPGVFVDHVSGGTAPLRDRHAGGARRLLLLEARPASLGAGRLRRGPGGSHGGVRHSGHAVGARPQYSPRPGSVAAVERGSPSVEVPGHGCGPRSGHRDARRAQAPPLHVRRDDRSRAVRDGGASAAVVGQAYAAQPGDPWLGVGGSPCTYGGQCSTFSPFGEPYRDAGLVGVFIFAVLFGIFWKGAWLYYLRHRDTEVALVAYCTLLPFMITWMRGNFILPAMEAALTLAVVVVAGLLCRTRPGSAGAVPGP